MRLSKASWLTGFICPIAYDSLFLRLRGNKWVYALVPLPFGHRNGTDLWSSNPTLSETAAPDEARSYGLVAAASFRRLASSFPLTSLCLGIHSNKMLFSVATQFYALQSNVNLILTDEFPWSSAWLSLRIVIHSL